MEIKNIHEQLWDAFSDIYFEEETHKYTDSLGTNYTSATTWISQFGEKFDSEGCAKRKSAKTGVPFEDYLKEWAYKGEYACNIGTQIHSVLENLWYKKDYRFDKSLNEKFPEMEEDFNFRKERCKTLFNKLKKVYCPVENEFIVYDQPNGVCGTIDFLAWNRVKKIYSIIDWKTSKEFQVNNHWGKKMLEPFSDMDEANCNHYSLQLSLYKYMLEKKTDIRIGEMVLFQIPGKEEALPKVHVCRDLSQRIATILA